VGREVCAFLPQGQPRQIVFGQKRKQTSSSGSGQGNGARRRSVTTINEVFASVLQLRGIASPEVVYHYCSWEVAQKIILSGTLWATDLREVRDGTEVRYSCEVLDTVSREPGCYLVSIGFSAAEIVRDVCLHITCFSASPTLRNQWRLYADKGRGCAIGFRFQSLTNLCHTLGIDWSNVAYAPAAQQLEFRRLLACASKIARRTPCSELRTFQDELIVALTALMIWHKASEFSGEREWRFMVGHASRFASFRRPAYTFKLPLCTKGTFKELILGSQCPVTIESARRVVQSARLPTQRIWRENG
jgi:hypothetical protein